MNKAKVSVIVPICNVEKYVGQCLESLRSQTMQEIEIICIDDGSTDNSGRIADEFAAADERFKVIHKVNTGYGDSMNLGLKTAVSEYIAVLESDDFAAPEMIERLYETAVKYDAQIVKSNFYGYYDDPDKCMYDNILEDFPRDRVISPDEYAGLMLMRHCVWNSIYRHDFLEENDIWFNTTPGASYQDVGFMCKCWYNVKKVVLIDDALVYYRKDNPNSSVKSPRKVFCVCDEHNEIHRYLDRHPECLSRAEKALGETMFTDYWNTYGRLNIAFKYAFLIRMRDDLRKLAQAGLLLGELFTEEHMEMFERLDTDIEKFFDNYSNYHKHLIMENSYDFLNSTKHLTVRQIVQKADSVYLYGAGQVGRQILGFIDCWNLRDKVKAFLVADMKDNAEVVDGIPVQQIDYYCDEIKDSLVIVALAESKLTEVTAGLSNLGFKKVMYLSWQEREQLRIENEV